MDHGAGAVEPPISARAASEPESTPSHPRPPGPNPFGAILASVRSRRGRDNTEHWKVIKAITQWLSICRFSIGALVVVTLTLFLADQSADALRVVSERHEPACLAILAAASLFWAYSSFYFPRVLLQFRYPGEYKFEEGPEAVVQQALVDWGPRVLGVLPLLVLGVAILVSTGDRLLGLSSIGFGLVALAFLGGRRWIFDLDPAQPPNAELTGLGDLSFGTQLYLLVHAAAFVVSLILFVAFPVEVGQRLGALTILLIATSAWISAGSLLTYWATWKQWPILTLVMLLSTVFSFWNDNHAVLPPADTDVAAPSVHADFDAWYDALKVADDSDAPAWFVVATEGGGIRAAYWTATVLAGIERAVPGFGHHVYAISGVSGGSLGAGVYVSLLASHSPPSQILDDATGILSGDFLSPPIAKGLYADFVQRILPFPLHMLDRGTALEEAWTRALDAKRSRYFGETFTTLWRENPDVPRLFANATVVETGQRAIVSYPELDTADAPRPAPGAIDVLRELGPVSLVQGIHLSARFAYVSPPGLFPNPRAPLPLSRVAHVVDGGYFENSGAGTAQDIVRHLWNTGRRPPRPYYILIQFDDGHTVPPEWSEDLLGPVRVTLNARVARATLAVDELRGETANGNALVDASAMALQTVPVRFEFQLEPGGVPLPLGWVLSDRARAYIDRQLPVQAPTIAKIQGAILAASKTGRSADPATPPP